MDPQTNENHRNEKRKTNLKSEEHTDHQPYVPHACLILLFGFERDYSRLPHFFQRRWLYTDRNCSIHNCIDNSRNRPVEPLLRVAVADRSREIFLFHTLFYGQNSQISIIYACSTHILFMMMFMYICAICCSYMFFPRSHKAAHMLTNSMMLLLFTILLPLASYDTMLFLYSTQDKTQQILCIRIYKRAHRGFPAYRLYTVCRQYIRSFVCYFAMYNVHVYMRT